MPTGSQCKGPAVPWLGGWGAMRWRWQRTPWQRQGTGSLLVRISGSAGSNSALQSHRSVLVGWPRVLGSASWCCTPGPTPFN